MAVGLRKFIASLLAILVLAASAPTAAQRAPKTCSTDAFVTVFYNLSQTNRSFDADIWFWTACPDDTRMPLKQMDYMTADRIIIGLDSTLTPLSIPRQAQSFAGCLSKRTSHAMACNLVPMSWALFSR